MTFKSRLLFNIFIVSIVTWGIFFGYLYSSLSQRFDHDVGEKEVLNSKRLVDIQQAMGNGLVALSRQLSSLVFEPSLQNDEGGEGSITARIGKAWKVFRQQTPLLNLKYYDTSDRLLGSWGANAGTQFDYHVELELRKRALQEQSGLSHISCQKLCYFHTSHIAHSNSKRYGYFVLSLPLSVLFDQFKSFNNSDVMLLGRPAGIGEYIAKTETTPFLASVITSAVLGAVKTGRPQLIKQNGKTYSIFTEISTNSRNNLFLFSDDVSAKVIEKKREFIKIVFTSLLTMFILMGFLYVSLSQIFNKIREVTKILPYLGAGDFVTAQAKISALTLGSKDEELEHLRGSAEQVTRQLKMLHSDLNQQNSKLKHLAEYDSLTGVFNRRKFTQNLADAHKKKQPFFLLTLDLDNFKRVNDALGHAIGDKLLIAFAELLVRHVPDRDMIGRIGGDEFSFVVEGLSEVVGKKRVVDIVEAINNGCKVLGDTPQDFSGNCVPSVGIVHYPSDTRRLDELSIFADAAMYENKHNKKGPYHFYSGNEKTRNIENKVTIGRQKVLHALQHDLLVPYYQPIVSLESGETVAYEVLARIVDEQNRADTQAHEFIESAERSGCVVKLDRAMLNLVLCQMCELSQPPILMINVSSVTFSEEGTAQYIEQSIQRSGYPGDRVVLEITESAEIKDFGLMQATMSRLHGIGVRFALDDFGKGRSSIDYLINLKIDYLKIDKEITHGLLDPKRAKTSSLVVASIVHFASKQNIKIVAEGVESDELRVKLKEHNLDFAQGYLFGRPAPWDIAQSS